MVGTGHEPHVSVRVFHRDNRYAVQPPDIGILYALSHPLGKGLDFIDGNAVCQLRIVKHIVGAVTHRYLLGHVPVRINHLVRPVL